MNNSLLKNNANLDPVGVIYNIGSSTVESFVADYLRKLNVDVLTVKTTGRRNGKTTEVITVAFFNRNSKDIVSKSKGNLGVFQDRIGGSSYKPSNELRNALTSIARNGELSIARDKVYCRLDIFKCLGLMLGVDFRTQELYINDVQKVGDESLIMEVIKGIRYSNKTKSMDSYRDIMSTISDR